MNDSDSVFRKMITFFHYVENGTLVGVLLIMILMAVAQILLRNMFETAIVWGDSLVRVLVLWVGLLGAMVATKNGKHIRIDLLARIMPSKATRWIQLVVDLFTSIVCAVVFYYSISLVYSEYLAQTMSFAQVPTWLCMAIIPFGFAIMAIRFFLLSFFNFSSHKKGLR